MTTWKPGDTVTFTLTGTIATMRDDLYCIETENGHRLVIHKSAILGTPEQAKRDRIMAIIEQEFPVRCKPLPDKDIPFAIVFKNWITEQRQREEAIRTIQARIKELEEQFGVQNGSAEPEETLS